MISHYQMFLIGLAVFVATVFVLIGMHSEERREFIQNQSCSELLESIQAREGKAPRDDVKVSLWIAKECWKG